MINPSLVEDLQAVDEVVTELGATKSWQAEVEQRLADPRLKAIASLAVKSEQSKLSAQVIELSQDIPYREIGAQYVELLNKLGAIDSEIETLGLITEEYEIIADEAYSRGMIIEQEALADQVARYEELIEAAGKPWMLIGQPKTQESQIPLADSPPKKVDRLDNFIDFLAERVGSEVTFLDIAPAVVPESSDPVVQQNRARSIFTKSRSVIEMELLKRGVSLSYEFVNYRQGRGGRPSRVFKVGQAEISEQEIIELEAQSPREKLPERSGKPVLYIRAADYLIENEGAPISYEQLAQALYVDDNADINLLINRVQAGLAYARKQMNLYLQSRGYGVSKIRISPGEYGNRSKKSKVGFVCKKILGDSPAEEQENPQPEKAEELIPESPEEPAYDRDVSAITLRKSQTARINAERERVRIAQEREERSRPKKVWEDSFRRRVRDCVERVIESDIFQNGSEVDINSLATRYIAGGYFKKGVLLRLSQSGHLTEEELATGLVNKSGLIAVLMYNAKTDNILLPKESARISRQIIIEELRHASGKIDIAS